MSRIRALIVGLLDLGPYGLIGLLLVCLCFMITPRKHRYPLILFIAVLLLLAGGSSIDPLRARAQGALRWAGLAALCLPALTYGLATLRGNVRLTPVHLGCALFLALAFASVFYTPFQKRYVIERWGSNVLVFVAVFAGLWGYIRTRNEIDRLLSMLYVLTWIVTVASAVMLVSMPGTALAAGRLRGIFVNANGNGIFCASMLPLVMYKFLTRSGRGRLRAAVLMVLLVCFVLMSGSRGSILSGFGAIVVVTWLIHGKRAIGVALTSAVLLCTVWLGSQTVREVVIENTEDFARLNRLATLTHRTQLWSAAWPFIARKPFFGHGFGVSRYIFLPQGYDESMIEQFYGRTLHSMHVQMAVDLGLAGCTILWAFMIYVLVSGARLSRRRPLGDNALLAACLFGSVLVPLADTLIHGWLNSAGSPQCLLFWVTMACYLRVSQMVAQEEPACVSPSIPSPSFPEKPAAARLTL